MRSGVRLPLEALSPYLLDLNNDGSPQAPCADWRTIFGNDHPVEIEVGFGKGLFLLNSGATRSDTNFLGIEIEKKYTLYTANRIAKRQLGNVRVCCGDARVIFEQRVPESSVQALHIFFPDPWWKTKHRKRRLFTAGFAQACVRALKPGGGLNVVSDVAEYFAEITELLGRQERLQTLPPPSPSEPRHDLDFLTNFERKYRQEGRPIHRACWVKTSEPPA
jgi:tRNA (guanine-N7-)-methyltransferase